MDRRKFLLGLVGLSVVPIVGMTVAGMALDNRYDPVCDKSDETRSWGDHIDILQRGKYLFVQDSSGKVTLLGRFPDVPVGYYSVMKWSDTHIEMVLKS